MQWVENRVEMAKMNYFVMPINNKYHCVHVEG
jgi:Ulp1 family protease